MIEPTNSKAAIAEVAAPAKGFNVPDSMITGGSISGAAVTIVLFVLAFRKRLSKDNLELTKDRAETDIIQTYREQVKALHEQTAKLDENAREAWRTRAEDAKRIGELTSRVEHLTEVNTRQENTIVVMRTRVEHLSSMVRSLLPPADRLRFDVSNNGNLQFAQQENQNGTI